MTNYVPILKGMPGEITGWANLSAVADATTVPIFEAVPKYGLEKDLENLADRLTGTGKTVPVSIDLGLLDQAAFVGTSGLTAIPWLVRAVSSSGLTFRPVVRFDDPPLVLGEAAAAAKVQGVDITLRWGGYEADPEPSDAAAALPRLLSALSTTPASLHLVIDMFEVLDPRAAARAGAIASSALIWAATSGPWASVTVASGAFPASVSNLSRGVANRIDRFDAQLWRHLSPPPGIDVDFGDYGVNNPTLPSGNARGPLPSMRYTDGREWIVWRETKQLPGNESFFTVCAAIVNLPAFRGAQFSWGDAEIDRSARSIGGAGTATQWRSYATSHHVETVIDRLASLGEP